MPANGRWDLIRRLKFNDYRFNKAPVTDCFNPEIALIGRHIPFLNLTMRNQYAHTTQGGALYFVCSGSGEFCARVQACVCVCFQRGINVRGGRLFVTTCTGALPTRETPRNNSAVNSNTDGTVHLTDCPAGRLASRITVYAGVFLLWELQNNRLQCSSCYVQKIPSAMFCCFLLRTGF